MSTTSAAQVEMDQREYLSTRRPSQPAPATIADLKLQTAERLAAHRALRRRSPRHAAGPELFEQQTAEPQPQSDTRATRIAAAVAERYAHSQSYRAFLAAEAERAVEQAHAAAQAARDAQAVAVAQQQLLSDLDNWTPEDAHAPFPTQETPQAAAIPVSAAALTVRLFENSADTRRDPVSGVSNAVPYETLDQEDCEALDEEIAFRQSPVFEDLMEPTAPFTANLIEFPRQLIAPRKARPRLAEGPLREEPDEIRNRPQLRIFEVEADQISTVADTESNLPEWSSIRLSACAVTEPVAASLYIVSSASPILAAPLALRWMSAIVDGSILLGGFLCFATIAAYTAGQVPTGLTAAISSAGVLTAMFLAYYFLFFTFAEATPGMRYARIGLCTLTDENPSRAAMRRRLLAILLAACPLGIGFLWAAVDDDGLGWHDRISRMYQRGY